VNRSKQPAVARERWAGVVAALAVLPGLCFCGFASADQTGSTGRQTYEPGEIHLENSRVYIHVDKTGLGHEHAVEGKLASGALKLDGSSPPGELVFDMASFTADTDTARRYIGLEGSTDAATRDKVTSNMRGADVLNVQQYPTARFEVTSVSQLQERSRRDLPQYQIEGRFTLCGTTRPIRITADAESRDGWTHLRGGFSILQSAYGMTPFSTAFGTIGVADRLAIWGDFWIAERVLVVEQQTPARR
jgi:YceI-like domain